MNVGELQVHYRRDFTDVTVTFFASFTMLANISPALLNTCCCLTAPLSSDYCLCTCSPHGFHPGFSGFLLPSQNMSVDGLAALDFPWVWISMQMHVCHSRVYSCLRSSFPGSTTTLTTIKRLLKTNEWIILAINYSVKKQFHRFTWWKQKKKKSQQVLTDVVQHVCNFFIRIKTICLPSVI